MLNSWQRLNTLNTKLKYRQVSSFDFILHQFVEHIKRLTSTVREKNNNNFGKMDCSICLEPLYEQFYIRLRCGHEFHTTCIRQVRITMREMQQ